MGLILVIALFANDNMDFFNKIDADLKLGKTWHYVGAQAPDPKVLYIPLVNKDTGKETIIFKLQ